MKVIFLDFDGVLNSDRYVRNCGHFGVIIDPTRMELLKQIVNATDAEIVLTTSWREHWSPIEYDCDETGILINSIFKQYNLKIFDKTPQLTFKREQEIKKWLDDLPNVESFVVLDDKILSAPFLTDHFVLTADFRDGLDEDDVKRAIEILNRKKCEN